MVTVVIPPAVFVTIVFPSPDSQSRGGGKHDPAVIPDGSLIVIDVKGPCIVHTREKSLVVMKVFFDVKDNPEINKK